MLNADGLHVLYHDDALLVCEKPAGCLSEPGPGQNLPALSDAWLEAHGERPGVRTVHRLDKAVGGLMVLARTQQAAASLIDQIASHSAGKEYLAVLRGVPAAGEAVLEDLLFHDGRTNKTFVVTRPRKGVREASDKIYDSLGGNAWSGSSSIPGGPIRSASSSPTAGCPCWGISATAARLPTARPCFPAFWPLTIRRRGSA